MMRVKLTGYLCILLLPFVVCGAFLSLEIFVLCTADGHAAAIEPVHAARTVCVTHGAQRCCRSEGATERITHSHVTCKDVPLRLNQGHIQDRERLLVVWETYTYSAQTLVEIAPEALVTDPFCDRKLEHLKSVVLLI
jgi:hypothetical protein